jgi:hypothetical protein
MAGTEIRRHGRSLNAYENEPTCAQSCGVTECADMMTMPIINSTCSTNSGRPESPVRLQRPPFLPAFLLFDRAAGFLSSRP